MQHLSAQIQQVAIPGSRRQKILTYSNIICHVNHGTAPGTWHINCDLRLLLRLFFFNESDAKGAPARGVRQMVGFQLLSFHTQVLAMGWDSGPIRRLAGMGRRYMGAEGVRTNLFNTLGAGVVAGMPSLSGGHSLPTPQRTGAINNYGAIIMPTCNRSEE
jgi:hypothetical protein